VREVLRSGRELHVADWGKPHNALMWIASLGIWWLDGAETTADNLNGRLVRLMEEGGFSRVEETHQEQEMTIFGTLSLYRAVVPRLAV